MLVQTDRVWFSVYASNPVATVAPESQRLMKTLSIISLACLF